jgi:hypothetical protein
LKKTTISIENALDLKSAYKPIKRAAKNQHERFTSNNNMLYAEKFCRLRFSKYCSTVIETMISSNRSEKIRILLDLSETLCIKKAVSLLVSYGIHTDAYVCPKLISKCFEKE